jgi:molybdopterin biosynthesis enzyme
VNDVDALLTKLVAQLVALPPRPDPNVRVLAASEPVAQAVATILADAGAAPLALTLPDDIDDALGLIENLLPGADLVVIAAGPSAPIRAALDVLADLDRAAGLVEPGADTAWGMVGRVPLLVLPGDEYEASVAAHVIGVPAVRARAGAGVIFRVPRAVTIDAELHGLPRTRRFVPGRVSTADPDVVSPLPNTRSLAAADVLLVVPDSASVQPGDLVAALPLRGEW